MNLNFSFRRGSGLYLIWLIIKLIYRLIWMAKKTIDDHKSGHDEEYHAQNKPKTPQQKTHNTPKINPWRNKENFEATNEPLTLYQGEHAENLGEDEAPLEEPLRETQSTKRASIKPLRKAIQANGATNIGNPQPIFNAGLNAKTIRDYYLFSELIKKPKAFED